MATLKIPEKYRSGFAKLIGLSEESFMELFSALADSPPTVSYKELSASLASRVRTILPADINTIVPTLFSLYITKQDREIPTPDFVKDICEAMEKSGDERLKLSDENREQFKRRLVDLLSFDALGMGSKALDVMNEHQHTVCSLRVLTDIRPVFGLNLEGTLPAAAVIVHTLKINYHEGNQLKEFFVAMDIEDVQELKKLLDRAELKAKSLKSVLEAANVPHLDVKHKD